MNNYNASVLWESILKNVDDLNDTTIETFREIGGFNNRLGVWDPIDKSSRYYKTLLLDLCFKIDLKIRNQGSDKSLQEGEGFLSYFDRIDNQSLGNPVTVKFFGRDVSLDYAMAIEELYFAKDILTSCTSVLEIGAGFGRTCHSILCNYENIDQYVICDLPSVLKLSQQYLLHALPKELYSKILFLPNTKFDQIKNIDCVINIDSFQEMDKSVIMNYLDGISGISKYFFSKNITSKYHPSCVNLSLRDDNIEYQAALKTGLCTDVVDIFDTSALASCARKYVEVYCPKQFDLIKDEPSDLFRQFHLALYTGISHT